MKEQTSETRANFETQYLLELPEIGSYTRDLFLRNGCFYVNEPVQQAWIGYRLGLQSCAEDMATVKAITDERNEFKERLGNFHDWQHLKRENEILKARLARGAYLR